MRLQAAVLVPVYRNESGELILVLVRRAEGDIHGGQIAFPGGKKSSIDKTLLDTALRETTEETGLPSSDVVILEQLPSVHTQTSQFDITPYLAKIIRPDNWTPSQREVAEILEVPLIKITHPDSHGEEIKNFKHLPEPKVIPFYRIGKYEIWGATYRILNPIMKRLSNGYWEI